MAEHGRLIDADALKESIRCSDTDEPKVLSPKKLHKVLTEWIDKRPTIEERKTGKWIIKEGREQGYDIAGVKTWYLQIMCDKCGFIKTAIEGRTGQYNYCPNCGADMRGEQHDSY